MTQTDFNHLLSSIRGLSLAQLRQLRQQLDRQIAEPKKRPAPASARGAKRAVADNAKPKDYRTKPERMKMMHAASSTQPRNRRADRSHRRATRPNWAKKLWHRSTD